VKVHSDTDCVAIDAKVARLGAKIAHKDAALRYAKPFFEKGGDAWNLIEAALSPDTDQARTCTFHPDGCPEGSHRPEVDE